MTDNKFHPFIYGIDDFPSLSAKRKRERKRLFLKALAYCFLFGVAVGVFYGLLSWATPIILDKLEHQREETRLYNCKYYGDDINAYYGLKLCETSASIELDQNLNEKD